MPSTARQRSVLAGVPNDVPGVRPSEIYRGISAEEFDRCIREWYCPCAHEIHLVRFGEVRVGEEFIGQDLFEDPEPRVISAPFTVRKLGPGLTTPRGPRFVVDMVQAARVPHRDPNELNHQREQLDRARTQLMRWVESMTPPRTALETQAQTEMAQLSQAAISAISAAEMNNASALANRPTQAELRTMSREEIRARWEQMAAEAQSRRAEQQAAQMYSPTTRNYIGALFDTENIPGF